MVKVDRALVRRVAALAMLDPDAASEAVMEASLRRVLALCERLQEVDTSGVAPLYFVNAAGAALREDVPVAPVDKAAALRNAPDTDGDYFRVPKSVVRE